MLIPIRIDRTSKPPLGTPLRSDGHWSVQGLSLAFDMNEGGGRTMMNAVSGKAYSANGGVFLGNDYAGFPDNGSFNLGSIIECDTSDFTVISILRNEDPGSENRSIISHGVSGWYFRLGANKLNFLKSNVFDIASGNTVLAKNVYYTVALTNKVNQYAFYLDGIGDGAGTHSQVFSFANPVRVGADPTDTIEDALGRMKRLLFFRGALSPSQIASISANPWQIYEPETVWVEVGASGVAVFEGAFTSVVSLSQTLSGQLGCGGGMSAIAGGASYSCGGMEGKQGAFDANLAAIIQALSGNAGNSAVFSAQTASVVQSLGGSLGVSGQLAAAIADLAAMFGEQVVFQGSISSTLAALSASITGIEGKTGSVLASISVASLIAGATGNSGPLQTTLDQLAAQLSGSTGVSGSAAMTISTGADMAGKLGVSASITSELAAMGAHLIEIVIGGKIHRIVISTRTGAAVILTKTGHINIITN